MGGGGQDYVNKYWAVFIWKFWQIPPDKILKCMGSPGTDPTIIDIGQGVDQEDYGEVVEHAHK